MRRPDFRQVGLAGSHHVKPKHGEQGPRPAGQQVVHGPAGRRGLEYITRSPDDHVLINVVADSAELLNGDLPDPEREIRGQGILAAVNEWIERTGALLGGRRGAGGSNHEG